MDKNSLFFRPIFVLFLGSLFFTGCASKKTSDWAEEPYHTRIYEGKYDQVWLAALKALADYPLKISNKDVGKIHSEVVNGPYNDLMFSYPDKIELPERFRYHLRLRFAKFAKEEDKEDDQPLVRVRVIKNLERYRDFYTGWLRFPSDGIEEKILLYRIEHILNIEKQLAKLGY